MNDRRSIKTKFWDDTYIIELNSLNKLLYLYLLTNPLANILGIYEIALKRIEFDTGLKKETLLKGLKQFEKANKVYYKNGYIIITNFLKNQHWYNSNMKKGVIDVYNNLPEEIKSFVSKQSEYERDNKGFQTLSNHLESFGKHSTSEREDEGEDEGEDEEKNKYKTFIENFNKVTGKKIRVPDKKFKQQYNARIKEGFTVEEVLRASKNCSEDSYHKENGLKYLTPEFITRADKLQKYLNTGTKKKKGLDAFDRKQQEKMKEYGI